MARFSSRSSFSRPDCWRFMRSRLCGARARFRLQARQHLAALRRAPLELARAPPAARLPARPAAPRRRPARCPAPRCAARGRDALDLLGPGAPEVAVVGEHAPGARRILLIQQELQRLFAADEIGGAELTGEGLPLLGRARPAALLLPPGVARAPGASARSLRTRSRLSRTSPTDISAVRSSRASRSALDLVAVHLVATRSISALTAFSSASVLRASCAAAAGGRQRTRAASEQAARTSDEASKLYNARPTANSGAL